MAEPVGFAPNGALGAHDAPVRFEPNPTPPTPPAPDQIGIFDEGVFQGLAQAIDFVGAGVTAGVAGALATVTVPGGGGGSATRVIVPLAFPAQYTKQATVVDGAVGVGSRVLAWVAGVEVGGDLIDVSQLRATAQAGAFVLDVEFHTPFAGDLPIDYAVF